MENPSPAILPPLWPEASSKPAAQSHVHSKFADAQGRQSVRQVASSVSSRMELVAACCVIKLVKGESCGNSSKGARGKATHVPCYRGRNNHNRQKHDTIGNKGRQDRQHQGTRAE